MEVLNNKKESIDLLTEEEKDQAKKFVLNRQLVIYLLAGVIILQLGIFGFFQALVIISHNQLTQKEDQTKDQLLARKSLASVAADVATVKSKLADYNTFTAKYSGVDTRVNDITKLLPAGVSLTSLNLTYKGAVTLTGQSTTSEAVYQFNNELLKNSSITKVSFNTLSKSGDVYRFDLSFEFKNE